MTQLEDKTRMADSYLTRLGVAGALVAAGLTAFLIVVGMISLGAFPSPGSLFFGGDDATISSNAGAETASAPAKTAAPAGPAAGGGRDDRGGEGRAGGGGGQDGGGGSPPGGGTAPPGEGGGGSGPGGGSSPPAAPAQSPGSNPLGQTIENTTTGLGNTVNDVTGTNLGDNVSGLGGGINQTLAGLGGQ
jgi:hypothetical protein